MRWTSRLALLALLAPSSSAAAQQSDTTLAPLAFLAGSCWAGTFPDGRKTDEHCFEWMFDRKFLRDRHVVRGGEPYQGESVLGWDPNARRLAFWYWNGDGLVTVGEITYTADGIVFPERYVDAEGRSVELQAVWRRRGADAYQVHQRRRTPTGWETLWTMELRRRGPVRRARRPGRR